MPVRAYNDIPAPALDFLISFEAMDAYDEALTAAGLPLGDQVAPRRAVEEIVMGAVDLKTLPQTLAQDLKLAPEKAKQFAVQIAGRLLLPIAPVVGDVEGAIRSWGGDPAEFAGVERIDLSVPPAAPEEMERAEAEPPVVKSSVAPVAKPIAPPIPAPIPPKPMKDFPGNEVLRPLRPQESTEKLVRPQESAVRVASAPAPVPVPKPPVSTAKDTDAETAALVAAEQKKPAAAPSGQARGPALTMPPAPNAQRPTPNVQPSDLFDATDAAEVKAHAEKAKQAEAISAPAVAGIPALVAGVVAAAALPDAEGKARLEHIVDARLRDVRDAYGTRAELEKPVAAGGLGLSGRPVADLMEKIETAADAASASSEIKMAQDKADLIEKGHAREQAQSDVRQKEEQLLARRYAELTGKAPTQPVGAAGARASVGLSAEASISQAAKRIDADKVKQAVDAVRPPSPSQRPAPSGVARPTGDPSAQQPRPQMRDVQPVRRLVSPTDELHTLSLVDFRRLSKDPKEAAEKVMDKIDLLEKEGYGQRLAAVKAWRESPLNRWYVSAVQEAMARGLGVDALLAEKRAAGGDVPNDAEMQAVIQLNGRLRF